MEHLISWLEIPAVDFDRAVRFYQGILGADIQEMDMQGTRMGLFPSDGTNVTGTIIQGEGYTPAKTGVLIYLNGGKDLQEMLDKVEQNQGTVIVPKTLIDPEMGYYGMFIDTEGNRMGVHSMS